MGRTKGFNDRDHIVTRVKDYYQNLYSSKVCVDPPTITVDTDDDIPPVGADEVAKALKEMKKGKAPGNDEILVDILLKDGGDIVLDQAIHTLH